MVSFDPTWSAGYIDQGQFKNGTQHLLQGTTREMIASHMPYDYLWFLSYPITNTEFETGKLPCKTKSILISSEITKAEMQNEEQQLIISSIRIKENGVMTMIAEMLSIIIEKSVTFEKNNHLRI
jgi:hypothetical protein